MRTTVHVPAGFSLVETMVAITLLSIGLLGVASSAGLAAQLLRQAELRERAALEATQLLDSLVHARPLSAGYVYKRPLTYSWTLSATELSVAIVLTVTYPKGAGLTSEQFETALVRP